MSITNVYAGIEVVCGGGSDADVTTAIFNAFLQTKNLVSAPSNSETARTIKQNVSVYNSSFPIKFTRPKASTLSIVLTLTLNGITATSTVLSQLIQDAFTAYIGSLKVGQVLNINALDDVLFDTLKTVPIIPSSVQSTVYVFNIDSILATPTNGYLPISFDQYLTLTTFSLVLNLV